MSALQTAAGRVAGLVGRESWLVGKTRPAYESLPEWSGGGRGAARAVNGVGYCIDLRHGNRRPNAWHTAGTDRARLERLLGELGLDPVPLGGQADALGEHGLVHLSHRHGASGSRLR